LPLAMDLEEMAVMVRTLVRALVSIF